ncbi:acyltransferase family protein [Ancylobacter vacuolatus]|uniref:Peptidoglycan/LPS O-acetylase OafA/YrhL n=1 Tax=Ancylobacter vacuolatus TaxID=223389 RepID=A0ABU0DEU4_9HYPH|nr:acyltransferase [Ancylobacter vacuolatus]MDQ0346858.1 peptidoglycan/LPS O-acetylase OafA/YrhL [Ancylobacter vacuolatus]
MDLSAQHDSQADGRGAVRIEIIDVLRGIAAIAVVAQHVAASSGLPGLWYVLELSPGVFGVVLFFLISGFVIPLSVRGAPDWRAFALRRVFRIYPLTLFAFALLAALIMLGAVPPPASDSATVWLVNLLLLQDFLKQPALIGVTWTLPIEFAWYGLFGLSFFLLGRRGLALLSLAYPIGMAGLILFSLLMEIRLPFGRIGMFYAAIIGMQCQRFVGGEIGRGEMLLSGGAFVALMMVANGVAFGHFSHPDIALHQALVPWVLASLLFFLALFRLRLSPPGGLVERSLLFLGRISFSVYLLHPIVMEIVHPHAEGIAFIVAVCVGTVPLAWLSFTYVEKPGIEIGRALARRRRPVAA